MIQQSRRSFITGAGAGIAAAVSGLHVSPAVAAPKKADPFVLGMASYTFRKFGIDETLAMTDRLGLTHIAFKDFHLAMDSTPVQIKDAAAKAKAAGLNLYGCGVVYMNSESDVSRAFEYAATAGMKTIIGVPAHNLLPLVESKVKQYDIKLAIHNHGPGDERYPSPESAYEKVKDLDPRMGLCIDIGHTMRIGIYPSQALRQFKDRVHDIHIKDVTAATKDGTTCEIGRGVIDIPVFIDTVRAMGYTGVLALEYEKDADDPLAGSAESIGYLRGVLASR